MDCKSVIEQLIDYIDEALTKDEKENISQHIGNCEDCRKELEELRRSIAYVEEEREKIVVPEKFMDNISLKLIEPNKTTMNYKKKFRTVAVAVAIMMSFVLTAVATDGFGILNWWRQLSARESQPVYELLQEGYGDRVNLTAIDQDIKVTVESVLADDIKTVLLLEIEDLKQENLYGTSRDGMEFQGSFAYDEDFPEEFRHPDFSTMTLHSEEAFRRKFLINLQPLIEKESTLSLNIKALESIIVGADEVVVGNWDFEIPVKIYDVKTYDIHRDVEVDGNILTIEELTVGPTATLLTYSYSQNRKMGYNIEGFSDIQLFNNGKEYQRRFFGGFFRSGQSDGTKHLTSVTEEFDTIYLDDPREIEISVGGYEVHVKANAYKSFDIDMNESFPQELEYMDSKIIIESIEVGEDTTEIILRESIENRNYGTLEIDFRAEDIPFLRVQENWEEYYFIDADGTKAEGNNDNYFYYMMNMEHPILYITKNRITLQHSSASDNLPLEVRGPDKITPTSLVIRGYREIRRAGETIRIKLK